MVWRRDAGEGSQGGKVMKIKWNGHASFTITSSDGSVIVTDPYDPSGYGGALTYGVVDEPADVVLVSHDHPDHSYAEGVGGNPKVLKTAGQAKGIDFSAIEAAHDESGGKERGKNTVFAFTVDGVRVCFAGDLGHLLSKGQLEKLGPVDVLLAPVGGTFTVGPENAAKLVEQIKPRLVIPMHFKTAKCGFPLAGVDEFAELMTNVKKTGKSEVDIGGGALPVSGPEVWILEHAK